MLILGAGGHSKEVLEVLIQCNIKEELFFYEDIAYQKNKQDKKNKEEDKEDKGYIYGIYPIIHDLEEVKQLFQVSNYFVIGVGKPMLRYNFATMMHKIGGIQYKLHSSFAYISNFEVKIEGVEIMNGAFISNSVTIEEGTLINRFANVSHNVCIGKYCEISPQANILGGVIIEDFCSIGASSVILPKIKIGKNSIVGAGAVVTKNVPENSVVVGNPAKFIKLNIL